jgi:hypothetical protein
MTKFLGNYNVFDKICELFDSCNEKIQWEFREI